MELAPVYGSFPYAEPLLRCRKARMIEKHLEQLETEGKVEQRSGLFLRR